MTDTFFRIFFDLLSSFLLILYLFITPFIAGAITYLIVPDSLMLMATLQASLLLLPLSVWLYRHKRRSSQQT